MITKQQYIDSCLKEVKVFKHLFTKIVPGTLDFRPSEKQRSTKELLQFVAHAFAFELEGIKVGKTGDFKHMSERAQQVPVEEFLKKMDELAEAIKTIVGEFSDQDLAEEIDLFSRGSKQTRSQWLLELILKNMVGYKMQLFLYIKQSGRQDIGTRNVWHGEDPI